MVVTGSYLGGVINNKEFWSLVGDVYAMQVYPLSFQEILKAFDLFELYLKLDLYGGSEKEDYEKISNIIDVNIFNNTLESIIYCNKIINCNINDFRAKQRCFFIDLSIATHLLNLALTSASDESGLINEIFVFNCLDRSFDKTPSFATLNNGELDFLVKSKYDSKLYGIEVKAGKNSGKTISEALSLNKIDYALYLKGNTLGGIDKEKNIITMPIYLFDRFKFNMGERVLSRVDRVTLEANLMFKPHEK